MGGPPHHGAVPISVEIRGIELDGLVEIRKRARKILLLTVGKAAGVAGQCQIRLGDRKLVGAVPAFGND